MKNTKADSNTMEIYTGEGVFVVATDLRNHRKHVKV